MKTAMHCKICIHQIIYLITIYFVDGPLKQWRANDAIINYIL